MSAYLKESGGPEIWRLHVLPMKDFIVAEQVIAADAAWEGCEAHTARV